jgi:hypothetical protein
MTHKLHWIPSRHRAPKPFTSFEGNYTPTHKQYPPPWVEANTKQEPVYQATLNSRWRYCWTHGLCPHFSQHSINPGEGHNHSPTLENRQGGNNTTWDSRPRPNARRNNSKARATPQPEELANRKHDSQRGTPSMQRCEVNLVKHNRNTLGPSQPFILVDSGSTGHLLCSHPQPYHYATHRQNPACASCQPTAHAINPYSGTPHTKFSSSCSQGRRLPGHEHLPRRSLPISPSGMHGA